MKKIFLKHLLKNQEKKTTLYLAKKMFNLLKQPRNGITPGEMNFFTFLLQSFFSSYNLLSWKLFIHIFCKVRKSKQIWPEKSIINYLLCINRVPYFLYWTKTPCLKDTYGQLLILDVNCWLGFWVLNF